MVDFIVVGIILIMVVAASLYIYKEKKSGKRCIGCPDGGCNCNCHGNKKCCHSDNKLKSL